MIDKLERKYGRFAIKNLMKYVSMLYVLGFIVAYISIAKGVDLYSTYLAFDVDMILRGQVWRIVTFLIQPLDTSLFFMLIAIYLYYMIGSALERTWGSFRFSLFYISGAVFNLLAAVIIYVVLLIVSGGALHFTYPVSLEYINLSMFLAFGTIYSDVQLLLFFVIPIKIKYLSYFYIAIEVYNVVYMYLHAGMLMGVCATIVLVVSLLNYILFYIGVRRRSGNSFANRKRRNDFSRRYNEGVNAGYRTGVNTDENGKARVVITRHKCAVCGRTELDDDELEFRFCSKCDGNYEYCMNHLYTHTHVVREYKEQ